MRSLEMGREFHGLEELTSETEIGWDFDDTLVKFTRTMIACFNREHGTNIQYEDFISSTYEDVFGISKEEKVLFLDKYYQSDEFCNLELEEGAIEALTALKDAGKNQHIITARYDSLRAITAALVDLRLPNFFSSLNMINFHLDDNTVRKESKASVCKRLGIYRLVEDSERHSIIAAEEGIEVLLPDKPWNQKVEHPNITRFPNLEAIAEHLLTVPRKI